MPQPPAPRRFDVPLLYRLFFLYIEPVATAVGAYYAQFDQKAYLALSVPSIATTLTAPSQVESIVLTQLANMYFVFAFSEATVLRTTRDPAVWRVFLLGLLIADFGHLYSVHSRGLQIYWSFWDWNAIDYGNILFVYCGALTRICFLCGLGLDGGGSIAATKKGS